LHLASRSTLKVPDAMAPLDPSPTQVPVIVSATIRPTCRRGVVSRLASKSMTSVPLSDPLTNPPNTRVWPVWEFVATKSRRPWKLVPDSLATVRVPSSVSCTVPVSTPVYLHVPFSWSVDGCGSVDLRHADSDS